MATETEEGMSHWGVKSLRGEFFGIHYKDGTSINLLGALNDFLMNQTVGSEWSVKIEGDE